MEFVSAAYHPSEAWCTGLPHADKSKDDAIIQIHRRFQHEGVVTLCLTLTMAPLYPISQALTVSSIVDLESTKRSAIKAAHSISMTLEETCQAVAKNADGVESVLLVLNHAESWIEDNASGFLENEDPVPTLTTNQNNNAMQRDGAVLGRRLIYSHHIISKVKRSDLKSLAAEYELTGFMKIGWPGIIVIEGEESCCMEFYDKIRRWSWKFLVVRGEMQEKVLYHELDSKRLLGEFQEISNMSDAALTCKKAGLESLFKTAMKVYDSETVGAVEDLSQVYSALVLVDHMNDKKGYRKWLRRACRDHDLFLVVKQCFPSDDFSKRPKIFVGLVGTEEEVGAVLKRWRTSRVDVDSKGKPCLERQITVLVEQDLQSPDLDIDWDEASSENRVNLPWAAAIELLGRIGGEIWTDALTGCM